MKTHSLKRGQTVELIIDSLAPGGEGVGRDSGIPIFVNRVAPGDKVMVELFDVHSRFARASLLHIIEASPERAEPPCKLFKVCGGCQWQHLSYQSQLAAKKHLIQQSFAHIGQLAPDLVLDAVPAKRVLYYRNKVQFPVRHPHKSKRLLAGYFKQDSHDLVNIKHCPVQPEVFDRVLELAKALCEEHAIEAYDEKRHSGLLRFINIRHSDANARVLLTLVLNCRADQMPPHLVQLAHELMGKIPELRGVCANFNGQRGNRILGAETVCLVGEPFIEEVLSSLRADYPEPLRQGLRFKLSPTSFFQVNSEQAVRLLESICDMLQNYFSHSKHAKDLKEVTAIDAYSGVGAIALWLSQFLKKVVTIEENSQAVEDARLNADLNGITNVEFHRGKVEDTLPELLRHAASGRPDVVIIDPPRKGCEIETIDTIIKLAPQVIIYVSCNPVTLARDLKLLEAKPPSCGEDDVNRLFGYKTRQVLPIDLFPQTYHIESVTMLERELL